MSVCVCVCVASLFPIRKTGLELLLPTALHLCKTEDLHQCAIKILAHSLSEITAQCTNIDSAPMISSETVMVNNIRNVIFLNQQNETDFLCLVLMNVFPVLLTFPHIYTYFTK